MSEKIKILFIITQSEMGGAQRFLVELIGKLDRNKYEMTLAAGAEGGWEAFRNIDIPLKKLKYAQRKVSPIKDILAVFEIWGLIRKKRPDILFLNSSKPSLWGTKAAWLSIPRPKIVYRIGGWSFNDPQPEFNKKLWIFLEKMSAPLKDVVIVNNKHDLDQARKLRIKPKRGLELVHNGIDANKLHFFPREEARNKLGLAHNDYLIGTIANFYKTKGLGYLVQAMTNVENKKLVIIGDGREKKNIESLIKELDLEDKIKLLGKRTEAHRYLKAFDVFVLPSVKEGFPWVILEAMAAKVPIIATSVGAVPEIIINRENGIIIEPKEPQQIVEALDEIDNLNLVENAYRTVSEKFSLNQMANQIESILDSLD